MRTSYYTYLANDKLDARELLARLLVWQRNEFGRQLCQPTEDVFFKGDYRRTVRSSATHFTRGFQSKPLATTPSHTSAPSMPPSFNTVVAYEDVVAAKRAKEICDRLRCFIGDGITFEMHLWRFDVLRTPDLRDVAVNDAVQARIEDLAKLQAIPQYGYLEEVAGRARMKFFASISKTERKPKQTI